MIFTFILFLGEAYLIKNPLSIDGGIHVTFLKKYIYINLVYC